MANTPSTSTDPYFPNTFNNNEARFADLYANKENAFTKNTAFNKDFGTTAGTVLEGSKDAEYAKLASANTFTENQNFSEITGISSD
jgi:hypothetical protein